MKVTILFLMVISYIQGFSLHMTLSPERQQFEKFVHDFEKPYVLGSQESEKRFSHFQKNVDYITQQNKKTSSYRLGINSFADEDFSTLCQKMFCCHFPTKKQSPFLKHVSESESLSLPKDLNWNDKKKVSRVKNQAKCGSCWAFSATGALESMLRIKHNKNIDLSEQQLLDCSFSNHGCHGGLMDLAFQDINTLGGIESAESYPYLGEKKQCRVDYRRQVPQIGFIDYDYIEPLNILDMKKKLVYHGPFCSAVEVSSMDFVFYKEGIYDVTPKKRHDLNHAVLLTGYSEHQGSIPHWHLKNSWGKDWGEDGFMRIAMRDGEGVCGINIYGVYLK